MTKLRTVTTSPDKMREAVGQPSSVTVVIEELLGRVSASAAVEVGRSKSDHGDGSQTGADLVHRDALRGSVSEAERGGVCDRTSRKAGEKPAPASAGAGLRVGEEARE